MEGEHVAENKIFEPAYTLKTGKPVAAVHGLEDRLCVQPKISQYYSRISRHVEGIQEEVDEFAAGSKDLDAQEVKAMLHYIRFETTSEKKYANGIRDRGRGKQTISDFMLNPKAVEAGLTEAQLVALRLYTTRAYKFINDPLRNEERYKKSEQCPLPVTTFFISEAIKRLRALHAGSCSGEATLWRGMLSREVTNCFMQNGGTEMACMSTSADLNVAVRYSLSRQSLLFKIVSHGFMTMGADVRWLSAFPDEEEIVYPPLTYLKPTGRQQEVEVERDGQLFTFTVIEINPQI